MINTLRYLLRYAGDSRYLFCCVFACVYGGGATLDNRPAYKDHDLPAYLTELW